MFTRPFVKQTRLMHLACTQDRGLALLEALLSFLRATLVQCKSYSSHLTYNPCGWTWFEDGSRTRSCHSGTRAADIAVRIPPPGSEQPDRTAYGEPADLRPD